MPACILVVDDSPQNLLVASRHLEAAGHSVVTAATGEEALALIATRSFDLAILDILMPGMGGLETCRRIRAQPATANMPVMFMTALGDREATAPALEAGADDLLAKPFTRAELLLRTSALIRQARTTMKRRASTEDDRSRILESITRLRELSRALEGELAAQFREEIDVLEQSLG